LKGDISLHGLPKRKTILPKQHDDYANKANPLRQFQCAKLAQLIGTDFTVEGGIVSTNYKPANNTRRKPRKHKRI